MVHGVKSIRHLLRVPLAAFAQSLGHKRQILGRNWQILGRNQLTHFMRTKVTQFGKVVCVCLCDFHPMRDLVIREACAQKVGVEKYAKSS